MARTTHASACRGTSASENKTRLKGRLLCSTLILIAPAIAAADQLPTGASVARGDVSIATPGAQSMTITQGSDRAVVNWNSFSIGKNASVDIRQPSSSSAILNRVTGNTDSRIHGRLTANGQVHLVNPNGIFIGKSGRVETGGGFVASTLDVMDGDFMAGHLRYSGDRRSAGVTNRGAITVGRGGYAALIGGRVDNAGTVVVPLGKIGFAAGELVTLDVSGDGFLQVALPSEEDGNPEALIQNSGRVSADGGLIEMKAATARNAARNAINLSGVAEARSVSLRNGAVVLGGGGGGSVRVTGRVTTRAPRISAEAVTTSLRPQTRPTGGRIDITGAQIALEGARLDASGDGGGGLIRIGGDFAGAGNLAHADSVTIDAATAISVDALTEGDGGRAVIWSDLSTAFAGTISARGGELGGNGGFVEVSSARALSYSGLTDLRAPAGDFGTLLLDPDDILVPGTLSEADVETALSLGNLTLDTSEFCCGSDPGDITIRADIDWTAGTTFELIADRNIDILGAINGNADPAAAFVLNATGTVTLASSSAIDVSNLSIAADIVNANGNVTERGSGGSIVARDFNVISGFWRQTGPALSPFAVTDFQLGSGASFLRAAGGSGTAAAPYILTDAYGLQGMDSFDMLDSHFALGNDIDATSTAAWGAVGEGALGFDPIGNSELGFSASLEGNGFTVDGLHINRLSDVGLFFSTEATTSVMDLTLSNVDITGDNAGGLVATNAGTLSNVAVTGVVTGYAGETLTGNFGGDAGGLVAVNTGVISGASFDGLVTGSGTAFRSFAGGLVGSNGGLITDSSAAGTVLATADTTALSGGLVGINIGTISDSSSSADVILAVEADGTEVASQIGGFAAVNAGTISGSEATGDVTAFIGDFDPEEFESTGSLLSITPGDTELNAGGFVGYNLSDTGLPGIITGSRSENSIYVQGGFSDAYVGDVAVGGFAGRNESSISNSRADSDVSVLLTEDLASDVIDIPLTVTGIAGGFAGVNAGVLSQTGATGSVALEEYHAIQELFAGGHTGRNDAGAISDSFAQGPVSLTFNNSPGTGIIGGFVGRTFEGSLARVFASGLVTPPPAGTILSGGLVGENLSFDPDIVATPVTASYWDTQSTGQADSAGGIGLTTAAFEDTAGFFALAGAAGWDFDTVWAPGDTGFYPAIYSIDQVVFARPDPVTLQYGETPTASTTGSVSGGPSVYVFPPAGDTLDTAPLFADLVFPSDDVGSGTFTLATTALTSTLGETYRVVDLPAAFTITPAPLTITADDQVKTYGETFTFAGTEFSTSGLLFSDSVASVDLASDGALDTAPVAGSPYAITASNASGTGLSNYTIAYVDGAMSVDPAALTITADDQVKTYGETFTFAGNEFSTSGLLFSDSVASVDLASDGAVETATVAGSPYAITASNASGTGLDNYTIAYVDGTMTVDPAALSITADDQLKTYGETFTFAGTEFSTSGLLFSDSVASVDLASDGALDTAPVAGSPYAITASNASGTGLSNYTIAYVDGAMTVDPAALTITADDQVKTYGETFTFAGTEFTTSGLLFTDSVASVDLASDGAAETAPVAGAPYAITASNASGTGLGNYTIAYVDGAMTVDPAALTITADDQFKTYGETFTFAGTEVSTSGLLFTDSVASVDLASDGALDTAPVAGSPYAITASNASGTGLGNYTIAYVDGAMTVDPATLTITADDQLKTYGETFTFAGTEFTTSGLLFTDSVASVDLASDGALDTAPVAGSPYTITASNASGTGLSNYTIAYVDGAMTVDPAALTISADDQLKTYGETFTFAGTEFSTSGLLFSDSVATVDLASDGALATAPVAGSPYTITASNASGTGLDNYTIAYVDGAMTVDPAMLTITADDQVKTYGETFTFAGTEFTTSGLLFTDSVASVELASDGAAETAPVAGAPYAITASNASGTGLSNYTIAYVDGAMSIDPAMLTITADDQVKTYGETFTFTGTEFTTSGLLFSDSVASVDLASDGALDTAPVAGSPYAITASNASGTGLSNYTIAYVDGAMSVDPAALTITADDQVKTYGETFTFAGTEFTTSGLLFSDSVASVDLASDGAVETATVAGSPYAITASNASGSGLSNYTIAYVDGAMSVDPAMLTITADDQVKTYGEAFTFAGTEFSTSGLLFSDSVASVDLASDGALNTAAVAGSPYAITASNASGTGLSNYTIAYVDGAMSVDPAALTITADDQTKSFGETFTFAGTEFTTRGLLFGDSVDSATLSSDGAVAEASVEDGPYLIAISEAQGSGLSNYDIAFVEGTMSVEAVAVADEVVPLPTPPLSFDQPNPTDTIQITLTTDTDSTTLAVPGPSTTVDDAQRTLEAVEPIAATLEVAADACAQSDADVSRYLACLSDALNDFANELDEIASELPPGMQDVARIVQDARRGIDGARARAESRLAGATTEAEREAIRRDAINESRAQIDTAANEIRKAIAFVRADDPELASVQTATITRVSTAVESVGIELSRAVGL